MKMKASKLIAVMLAVLMLVSVVPLAAGAAGTEDTSDPVVENTGDAHAASEPEEPLAGLLAATDEPSGTEEEEDGFVEASAVKLALNFHGIGDLPMAFSIDAGSSFDPDVHVGQPTYQGELEEGQVAVFEGWRLENSDTPYAFSAIGSESATELNFFPVFRVQNAGSGDEDLSSSDEEGLDDTDDDDLLPAADDDTAMVTFYVGDEIYLEQEVALGSTVPVPANPALADGMVSFLGWSVVQNSGMDNLYDFSSTVDEAGGFKLYAQFSNKYLVSFRDADGEIYMSQLIEAGKTVPAPVDIPPSGNEDVFMYWFVEGGEDDTVGYDFGTPVNSNFVLAPKYGDSFYVYFNTNGGTPVDSQLIKSGEMIETDGSKINTTREGYVFNYWSLNGAEFDVSSTPITQSITLDAVWAPIMVNVKVLVWNERENLPFNFDATDAKNYVYSSSYTTTALAGSTFTVAEGDIPAGLAPQYSTYSRSTTVSSVNGDGSSVVNVYYTPHHLYHKFQPVPGRFQNGVRRH